MPAVANVVLADAQGSPVNHTFIPLGQDTKGVWWFEDQSGTSSIGYNRISMSLKRVVVAKDGTNSGNRVNKFLLKIYEPTMEVLGTNDAGITPPPTLSYTCTASSEYILPERASLQNRKDLRKYLEKVQADALVVAQIETLQMLY